jgi:hypothetical protein
VLASNSPTTVHAVGAVHDTPLISSDRDPAGAVGTLWIVQLAPSQRSANGPLESDPTAMQALPDEHDTPFSWLTALGLGVVWIVQLTPSQRSASCCPLPVKPTAIQAVDAGHDTLFSWLSTPVDAFGVAWIDHPAPFHASASVR